MTANGTLVLADIGGYTSFLSGVGITHAKEITEHLLNCLVKTNDRHWKVGNVMGDCVLFYTDRPEQPDRTFDNVRTLYHSFHDAKTEVVSGSTCRCGACDRTAELSLKFVVHEGEFDTQNIGGRRELIGHDIVLATRLLKNSVPVQEYLLTTPVSQGVAEAAGLPATPAQDDLESIGPTSYSYIDLTPIREAYQRSREFYITERESRLTVTAEIDAPAATVWEALMDLGKRRLWQVVVKDIAHVEGEEGQVGEVHQCLHGNGSQMIHLTTAVDHEGHRKTERLWVTPAVMKDIYITMGAEPIGEGRSRAYFHATFKPRYPVISHAAYPLYVWVMRRDIRRDIAGLKEYCETGKVAAREEAAAA